MTETSSAILNPIQSPVAQGPPAGSLRRCRIRFRSRPWPRRRDPLCSRRHHSLPCAPRTARLECLDTRPAGLSGAGVPWPRGSERRLGIRWRKRRRVGEGASARACSYRLMQGAAGQELSPGQKPYRPAVVPGPATRAPADRHRVPRDGQLVVGLGVSRGQVHASVTDVRKPLLTHRPVRVVQVVPREREPDRPGDLDVVAGSFHVNRVLLLDGEVGPVGRSSGGRAPRWQPPLHRL